MTRRASENVLANAISKWGRDGRARLTLTGRVIATGITGRRGLLPWRLAVGPGSTWSALRDRGSAISRSRFAPASNVTNERYWHRPSKLSEHRCFRVSRATARLSASLDF